MKISTNPIGNYAPNYINNQTIKAKPAAEIQKTETAALTKNEKEFFIKKYPENKADVADYHFYKKGGTMSGVSVGNLFDRRG
jgi:patatin-like phospholipase/acyl hydrolase